MNTTRIESSYGLLTIETPTGRIVTADLNEGENYLSFIERFDVAEFNDWFFRRYGFQPDLSELDVLELGYWRKDGAYVPPSDWRWEIRKSLEKEGTLIIHDKI